MAIDSNAPNKATKSPVVSVVMPVYNVQDYIETAVESVLTQTFTRFELIVIDDESPDDSIARIQ